MRKLLLIIVIPLVILSSLFFFSFYIYPQIPTILIYKLMPSNISDTATNLTPKKHNVSNIPKKTGKKYEYEGISITTDWSEKNIINGDSAKFIVFTNNAVIGITSKDANINIYDELRNELLKKQPELNIDTYFSNSGIHNNKDVYEKMLKISDKDININKTMDDLTFNINLLLLKKSFYLDTKELLMYNINERTYYQYSPLNNKTLYEVLFFDDSDNPRSITIKKEDISQEEIESIVKTIEIENY